MRWNTGLWICPNCGGENKRELRQCPEYRGMAVCTDCCKVCEYYHAQTYHCNWHSENNAKDGTDEINNVALDIKLLDDEILKKQRTMYKFRREGKAFVARKIEKESFELESAKREKVRILEVLKDEKERNNKEHNAHCIDWVDYYRV